jgi:hypothetical protein
MLVIEPSQICDPPFGPWLKSSDSGFDAILERPDPLANFTFSNCPQWEVTIIESIRFFDISYLHSLRLVCWTAIYIEHARQLKSSKPFDHRATLSGLTYRPAPPALYRQSGPIPNIFFRVVNPYGIRSCDHA